MTDETKESIGIVLQLLTNILVENGVSMWTKGNKIYFFDTDHYLKTSKFDGFKVNIEDLAR